jgi:hypothetical protein
MGVKIFVVFHKAVDERLIFEPFSKAEIDALFTLYAVNEKDPLKSVTWITGQKSAVITATSNVIFEYHLGWYNRDLQFQGFCETSCYVHILKNKLYETYDYIGVTQYDMRWSHPAAATVRHLGIGRRAYGLVCGVLMNERGHYHPLAFATLRNWDFLLSSYNKFFSTRWDKRVLINKPLTLFQTYILPRDEFVALASWLEVLCREVYPWANQPPYETHWGVLGGYTERAESLFVAARLHEGRFRLEHLNLIHDRSIPISLNVSKDHYGRLRPASS